MARVLKREAGRRDLIQQWVWYAENASVDVAEEFLLATERTLTLLSEHPQSGVLTFTNQERLQGIRHFPVRDPFGKILLFYFPLEDGIDLVRVVHGSRHLERLFLNDSQ